MFNTSNGSNTVTNKMLSLLNKLLKNKVIISEKVYKAMLAVDRGEFTDSYYAYEDSPQSIDYRATISAPHMHAYALEYLKDNLKYNGRVLDVGSGSGYLTVAFSKMIGDSGIVVGIEHIPQLYSKGVENISKSHSDLLKDSKISLLQGDGREGFDKYAPYDCIHVGAGKLNFVIIAAEDFPEKLIHQLAPGGRMMIPVGKQNSIQNIYLIDKDLNGNVQKTKILSVRYVPLTSKEEQLRDLFD